VSFLRDCQISETFTILALVSLVDAMVYSIIPLNVHMI